MPYFIPEFVEYEAGDKSVYPALILKSYGSSENKDTLYDLFVFENKPYIINGIRHLTLFGEVKPFGLEY